MSVITTASLPQNELKIDLIDIGRATPVTEKLLQVLHDVYNDAGKYTCHGETTHIIVLYDNSEVVGGALLRISNRIIVIKRLCVGLGNENSSHSSAIISYVVSTYSTYEIHITTTPEAVGIFLANGFIQRRRSLGCLCKKVKGMIHISWKPVKVVALIKGM
jgi:hypothetical protein